MTITKLVRDALLEQYINDVAECEADVRASMQRAAESLTTRSAPGAHARTTSHVRAILQGVALTLDALDIARVRLKTAQLVITAEGKS